MSTRAVRAVIAAFAVLLIAPAAHAQNFSTSYQFLDAIRKSDGATVQKLITDTNGRIVDTRDRATGESALHIVAKDSNAVYLRFLLQKGAGRNPQDRDGNTPMMVAVNSGFDEGVDILLKYNANPNIANNSGETPLIRAVQLRKRDLVESLLAGGADPDRADSLAGMSARDYARQDNRAPAIAKLLADAPKIDRSAVSGPR
jgi:uncharacterized protein